MKNTPLPIRIIKLGAFVFFYLKEIVSANIKVAHDVLTPHLHIRAGIVAVPLDLKKDISLVVLANLLSITPGTLSLDISTDRKVLYVHTLYLENPDAFRKNIKTHFERRLKEIFE
jgi:multicomponent Na+:H+ antiporter subunit E